MEDKTNLNLLYLSQLTESETNHFQKLLAPFENDSTVEQAKLFNQVARILGELSARVNVIEQAAESQLLVENPLNNGPLLHGNLTISATNLDRQDFHDAEIIENGQTVRWSKNKDFSVRLPLYRPVRKLLKIYFHAIIRPAYTKSLELFIDGVKVKHKVKKIGGELCLACLVPPAQHLAMTELEIQLPGTHAPSELGESEDHRLLGICMIRIIAENCRPSLFDRMARSGVSE